MGGQYNSFTSDEKDFKKVAQGFSNAQSEDEYENGHSYSGGWGQKEGLRNTGKVFDTLNEAEEWIQENNDKWGPADAVQYRANGKETTSSSNARKRLNEAVGKARDNLHNLRVKFEQEVKTAKSKFRACKRCESKVNREYVHGAECPVCRHTLFSPTQLNRLEVLEKKVSEAQTKQENHKPKYTGGKKLKWLVGGWCSC